MSHVSVFLRGMTACIQSGGLHRFPFVVVLSLSFKVLKRFFFQQSMTSLEAQIKDAEKAVLDNFDFLSTEGMYVLKKVFYSFSFYPVG